MQLQSVFLVLETFVRPVSSAIPPITAKEGDLIAIAQTNGDRAYLSVHRASDGATTREEDLYWTVASGWIFAASNDDQIADLNLDYQPISLEPVRPPSPVSPLTPMRQLGS